jgi:DNA helicase-2/ATP-dependent DNA helicase PcrA
MSQLALLSPLLQGLNDEQAAAVTTIQGPVLVVAAPGSGKTTVLTRRLAYLLQQGVMPEQILAVTFTKKAATEMTQRLAKLLGSKEVAARLTVATFNSLGLKLLEGNYQRLGYTVEKPHLLLESTQRSLFDVLLREQDAMDIKYEELGAYISLAKATLTEPSRVKRLSADPNDARMADLYKAYQIRLLQQNLIDFDDQIRLAVDLLQTQADVRQAVQARYTHVLVDEYQDTNRAQYTLMRLLAAPQDNLFAVGDDAQGIYGFRAADIHNILSFSQDYPHARQIFLETNYRSTPGIVKLANNLIAFNARQISKTIRAARSKDGQRIRNLKVLDQFAEAAEVVNGIKELLAEGTEPAEIAILYRTHAQSMTVINGLIEAQIPFVVKKSGSFYDQAEIQDLLGFLRLAFPRPHPLTEVAFEALLRRMGVSRDIMSILKVESERQGGSLWAAALIADRLPLQSLQQRNLIQHGVRMVQAWRCFNGSVADLVLKVLEDTRYRQTLEGKRGEQARQKLDCLSTFHEQVLRWAPKSLADLFHTIDQHMRPPKTKKTEAVQLLTIHSSKGLEWDAVFVIGLEEGTLPYQVALDDGELSEERRLCYVAITRARRYLQLSHCHERTSFGQKKSVVPSRFVDEMMSGRKA